MTQFFDAAISCLRELPDDTQNTVARTIMLLLAEEQEHYDAETIAHDRADALGGVTEQRHSR